MNKTKAIGIAAVGIIFGVAVAGIVKVIKNRKNKKTKKNTKKGNK